MGFADLSRLWLLLLLPVLYWLARPPHPRKRIVTAHMSQWRAAIERLRRRPVRFRRLRFLLLVGATLALIGAAAGLQLDPVPGPRRLVVVVDASASMRADGAWNEMRAACEEVVTAVPDGVEIRLVTCGASPAIAPAGDRASLLAALPAVPTAGPGRVDLAAFAADTRTDDVAVCTLTDALGVASPPEVGAVRIVGGVRPNLGITAARVEDAWPLPSVRVVVEVSAFGLRTDGVELVARIGSREVARATCSLDGGRGEAVLEFERGRGGDLAAGLTPLPGEGFEADDVVRFTIPPPPAPDVVALGDVEDDPWLATAAEVLADLGGGRVAEPGAERAGLVLVDGGRLESLPARAIVFGADLGGGAAAAREPGPAVVDWDRADPLLAGIDLSELRIGAALPPSRLPAGRALIHGTGGPLAVAVERPDGAVTLYTAFRLGDSNLGLLPALPQLLQRAYRAAWGARAHPVAAADNLCDPAESNLQAAGPRVERELPEFGRPGRPLAVGLVLLALLLLALRIIA